MTDTGCHSTDCKMTWREWIKWLQSPAQIQKNLPHTEINKQLFHKPVLITLIHPDKQGLQNTYPLKGSPTFGFSISSFRFTWKKSPCWLQKLWAREPRSRSPLRYSDACHNVKIRAIGGKEACLCQILKLPPSHLLHWLGNTSVSLLLVRIPKDPSEEWE